MPDLPDLPAGTVTFLFTDLEGSTTLLQSHPAAYRDAVRRHHALLRQAVEGHGGVVFETVGDAVYAAFAQATEAVAAALAGQVALQGEDWGAVGAGALRARMGLHTGEAEVQGAHYFGAPLYRCARLASTAHGGQVVLSAAVAEVVREALPEGAGLRDLGEHRLKDLQRPEHVFQLVAPDLPAAFPPLRSLDARPHNLPLTVTSFVGRERELGEVAALLGTVRLLTLTGPGGVGKTRLAQQAAADALEQYPDGVWLVELGALADPALVPQAVAQAVGVREEPGRPLAATLVEALRPQHLLVVLDNCEHLLDACARLADALLRACPHVRLLCTSREALGFAGESVWPVPSLPVPAAAGGEDGAPPAAAPDAEALARSAAVRLFAERAAAVQPGFSVSDENAGAVAQVCARLDGIPLAIELAAARVRVLPPRQLLGRLEDRFRLLTGGSRTALARHQTLQAAVDWSYDLLAEQERTLFARLAVFAGGWTLEAAEAVCAGEGVAADEVLDLLTRLVDKSLVAAEAQPDGTARYRLLETLRAYARAKLAAVGGAAVAAVHDRHAAHYLALAEHAEPELRGRGSARGSAGWRRSTTTSGRPCAGARRRAGAPRRGCASRRRWSGSGTRGGSARAARGSWRRWPGPARRGARRRGRGRSGSRGIWQRIWGNAAAARAWLVASVALWRELGEPGGLARALVNLGLATADRDPAAARPLLEEAVALARTAGDRWGLAFALRFLGYLEEEGGGPAGSGDPGRPSPLEESASLFREVGDSWGLGIALTGLGGRAFRAGDHESARARLEEALARRREAGDTHGVAVVLNELAAVSRAQGDLREAAARGEEGRALAQATGHTPLVAEALAHLGHVALVGGDSAHAAGLLAESLRLARAHGLEADTWRLARSLAGLAGVAATRGQPERALRLGAAAAALSEAAGWPLDAPDQAVLDGALARTRSALSAEAQAAAWDAGRAMTLEQAVAYALEDPPAAA